MISCHFFYNRNDLFINLIDGIIFVKLHIHRCSALEIQTVSQCPVTLGRMYSHNHESCKDHCNRNTEEHFLLAKEVDWLSFFHLMVIQTLFSDSDSIERKHDHTCNHQCCKH